MAWNIQPNNSFQFTTAAGKKWAIQATVDPDMEIPSIMVLHFDENTKLWTGLGPMPYSASDPFTAGGPVKILGFRTWLKSIIDKINALIAGWYKVVPVPSQDPTTWAEFEAWFHANLTETVVNGVPVVGVKP